MLFVLSFILILAAFAAMALGPMLGGKGVCRTCGPQSLGRNRETCDERCAIKALNVSRTRAVEGGEDGHVPFV